MNNLLTTKLYFPTIRHNWVSRPRLVRRLKKDLSGPLTLIAAPAGYGKTALMSEWHDTAGSQIPVAWISLDANDNYLTRFWFYLISALDAIQPDMVTDPLVMLETPQMPSIESLLTLLINDIFTFSIDLILALDDLHVITDPEIFQSLNFLLEHMPPNLHLVLLTRADPPLTLSRLRAKGQLAEIRAHELRFSVEETTEFLNEVMKLKLSADEIVSLEARTEGWIAGLQLAALSIQGQEDAANIISTFGGGSHYIVDFLVEEVLNRQPEHIRKFLLQTSILERLSGPLCAMVSGQTNTTATLQLLEQNNLFVFPLDGESYWYRYHQLFADVMRNRLRQKYPDQLPELHNRAAKWLEKNSFLSEAIQHTINAKNYEYTARLIEQYAVFLLQRGELKTLLKLIDSIESFIQTHPWLAIYRAWALTYTGQLEQVEKMLQTAERYLSQQEISKDSMNLEGNIAAIRAYNAAINAEAVKTIGFARQALDSLPENNVSIRSIVSFIEGGAHLLNNDIAKALDAWEMAERGGKLTSNLYLAVSAVSAQADIITGQGKLHHAMRKYNEALQLATRADGRLLPIAARALAGLGSVYYEWNDLEVASQHAQQCIKLSQLWGNPDTWIAGYVLLARIQLAQGDLSGAEQAIQEAETLKESHDLRPGSARRIDSALISLWLAQGKLDRARGWIMDKGIIHDDRATIRDTRDCIGFSRILLAQSKYDEVLETVRRHLEMIENSEHCGQTIDLLLIQALAFQAKGEDSQAYEILQRALNLAESEGYVRLFIDHGERLGVLLQKASAHPTCPQYAFKLLSRFNNPPSGTMGTQQLVYDQLSAREKEVLELIARGKTNQEIADELVIALGTVKRHVYNIYSKLGVKSRTECLAQARELHLLE